MNTEHVALFVIGAKITYTQRLKTRRPCHVASVPLFIFVKANLSGVPSPIVLWLC